MATPDPRYLLQSGLFEVSFVPASRLVDERFLASQPLLAVVQYGTRDHPSLSLPCPSAIIPLLQLNEVKLAEVWTSTTPTITGSRNELRYAANEKVLFGICPLRKREGVPLDAVTYSIYQNIFRLVEEQGYPNLLRVWNYLSDINEEQDDLERYRRFCVGRYNAFAEFRTNFERALPAGSGIGIHTPGVVLCFLASRETGKPVENPRQVNAYRYPPQYGPRSPSFSRAMINDWGTRRQLFLSGTASIVEHHTRHAGDTHAQLAETLNNIRVLLQHAADVTGVEFQGESARAVFKVYIRRPEDFPLIEEVLERELGRQASVLYLNGDLCRRDLLVEIEGVYQV